MFRDSLNRAAVSPIVISRKHTGRSSAWLERVVWDHEVAGSNPVAPIVFHAYVRQSDKTGRRYTGSCEDLEERLRRHNAGETASTKHGVPWRVVYTESFATRAEAVRRERELKTGRGRDELRRLLR